MTRQAIVEAVAALAVGAGLRTESGDLVLIDGSPPHRDLMLAAARECWRRGARYVLLRYMDDRAFQDRADRSPERWLDDVPKAVSGLHEALASEGWTRLVIYGDEDPCMFEGADLGRLARLNAASHRAGKPLMEAMLSFAVPWCLVPYPTDAWARLALDSPDASGDELWPVLLDAMRLSGGSAAIPLAHFNKLAGRAAALSDLRLDSLLFAGPGTDLRVGLSPRSLWMGGAVATPNNRSFTPNIPTEEIFTTPDFRRTEGRVTCTRPIMVMDMIVEGAWLEFRSGEVVASGASRNAEALERFLAIDRGARRLGEVALVDCSSPIWRSGKLFRNILLDENAACHIALGHGLAATFRGAAPMRPGEREAAGYNESLEHTDIMIGSDLVTVSGRDAEGRERVLMQDGRFTDW